MKRQDKLEVLPDFLESIVGDTADVFILLVDLCGSTKFKQNCIISGWPDMIWIFRQLFFLRRAAEIIEKHSGTVVKTIGDEILAIFEATSDPEAILKCAIEILQAFQNLKTYRGPSRIEAKASIDFGETYNGAIVDTVRFDPIGIPVDRCARLNKLSNPNEIVFSADFLNLVKSIRSFKSKYGYKKHQEDLKGIGDTVYFSVLTE